MDNKSSSPFRDYYFNRAQLENNKTEYLSFLSALRVFVNAIRDYKKGEILSTKDFVEFVKVHNENNIELNDVGPFAKLDQAVNFMTVHKAKGLEFETVFILSVIDSVWGKESRANKLAMPLNLKLKSDSEDNDDDCLRLFFVALTRAKKNLYISSFAQKDDGKEANKLKFLSGTENEEKLKLIDKNYNQKNESIVPDATLVLESSLLENQNPPVEFVADEKELLKTLVKDYKISVTHLNNFLDLTNGHGAENNYGPLYFLENNLLRFPSGKSLSGSFGSAIHFALERAIKNFKKSESSKIDKIVSEQDLFKWFEQSLKREKMSKIDFAKYYERGVFALKKFWQENKDDFKVSDWSEFSFANEGVKIGQAVLNGKIDRISQTEKGILEVFDFKTGKALRKWGKDIKSINYKRQLIFYKILVENSKSFGDQFVVPKGELVFIEPDENGELTRLALEIDSDEVEKLKSLLDIVYTKIISLEFLDEEFLQKLYKYPKTIEGNQQFEHDLLNGLI